MPEFTISTRATVSLIAGVLVVAATINYAIAASALILI
jgi:hypothetical protein